MRTLVGTVLMTCAPAPLLTAQAQNDVDLISKGNPARRIALSVRQPETSRPPDLREPLG